MTSHIGFLTLFPGLTHKKFRALPTRAPFSPTGQTLRSCVLILQAPALLKRENNLPSILKLFTYLMLQVSPMHSTRSPTFFQTLLLEIQNISCIFLPGSPFFNAGVPPFPIFSHTRWSALHLLPFGTPRYTYSITVFTNWQDIHSLPQWASTFFILQWSWSPTIIHPALSLHTRAPDFITLEFP